VTTFGVVPVALAASLALGALDAFAQTGIDRVAWLEGCWASSANDRLVEEHWLAPKGKSMIGVGRTTSGDRLVEYELVVLKEDGARLAYEAHPSGQPAAVFYSVSIDPNSVVFENLAHDFPQRVGYRRAGSALTAWIEGTRNGQVRRVEFPYERVPCSDPFAATRFPQNPLITVDSSPSLGGNVNGPTVIRVPAWVERPLGRYYMYFANHMGLFVRMAYADALTGPWKIYEPGVLHVRDTAFHRPQPDPPETLADFYTHVASPEIHVDHANRRIVMWAHGWWTNGERWPTEPAAARRWASEKRYGQFTQTAESRDGLTFYLRVFTHGGTLYGVSRLGQLSRASDLLSPFVAGPNPFREHSYAGKVRHVALVKRDNRLLVFFTAIGDAPERVLMSTIDLNGDWEDWRASPAVDILSPATNYECVGLPIAASAGGDIDVPARQIRDPFVFEEDGRTVLFYSSCGEQGISAAEITLPR
jgi:hypothetical protein